ncbi:TlyA family RNA methyltransferase, partial [Dermatophilus congolensis]|nr:TlyA family RNA methyltransferase [Dermatophilus congolensis]
SHHLRQLRPHRPHHHPPTRPPPRRTTRKRTRHPHMRLDAHLVTHKLARSRGHARELINAGAVTIDGTTISRPSHPVTPTDNIKVTTTDTWVSRAAHKLLGALNHFTTPTQQPLSTTIPGTRCLDLGACTGGFTQVLLTHGATHVTAIDVGHNQLATCLRNDPRVHNIEGLNVRHLTPTQLGDPYDIIVGDLSFISLRHVLPTITNHLTPTGLAILLVKPQFEVGRERLGKKGLVRDPHLRQHALREVLHHGINAGLTPLDTTTSPIQGTNGNIEYLVLWERTHNNSPQPNIDNLITNTHHT